MRFFINTFLFLILGIHHCLCQDSVAVLSAKMFAEDQLIPLSPMDGWLFKKGNDTSWAKKVLNTSDWIKLKPTELSAKYADETGKAEGWFRLSFRMDNDFANMPAGFRRGCWAATDIYLDGNLVASFGNTGVNGQNFEEYNPIDKYSAPANLEVGKEYLLAIHFVDYLSSLPPRQLRSEIIGGTRNETAGLRYLIMLSGPLHDLFTSKIARVTLFYRSIWLSVTAILALLFWFLVFQNQTEKKTLVLIAVCSSFSALTNLTRFPVTDTSISFDTYQINDLIQKLCMWIVLATTFAITIIILDFKLNNYFKRFLLLYSVLGIIIIPFNFFNQFLPINTIVAFFVILYILALSWKKIKGAQWAIAGGLLLSIFLAVLLVTFFSQSIFTTRILMLTCFYFSFPLSLVVYVSLRFGEIIKEVQENAKEVVRLSEEKKEQALNQQKILQEEVNRQTAELRNTLDNLRSTQALLIQSEKMASLGELTAGIAHEIQNPLNFVNNFSDVNKELIDELKSEKSKVKTERDEKLEDELLNDILANEEKINHHGKRADAIVKGMLQHSRSRSGKKESTDINALADEYLRLAYHGMRAKDKSFNTTTKTDFDDSIGKINVVPQDMGRVILNLINNAFYAVDEKKKSLHPPKGGEEYEPVVTVSTKRLGSPPSGGDGGKIEIRVADNGNGIPQKVLDKIFQPFFTTKPTGQGTGLGLSLSYDIVKAHGGEIKVETKEGEGSEFIIQIPVAKIDES